MSADTQTGTAPPGAEAGPGATTRMRPKDEKTWAIFCHLGALAGSFVAAPIPFANVVVPLVLWLIRRGDSPMVDAHGKESLNFQISMTIWTLLSIPLCFVCIGIPIVAALAIVNIVCIVVAAVRAGDGREYRYPLTVRFVR